MLDEVHERSLQSDFLSTIVRDILPRRSASLVWLGGCATLFCYCWHSLCVYAHARLLSRPDLKVILMSATINADLFSQYFGELSPLWLARGLFNHSPIHCLEFPTHSFIFLCALVVCLHLEVTKASFSSVDLFTYLHSGYDCIHLICLYAVVTMVDFF